MPCTLTLPSSHPSFSLLLSTLSPFLSPPPLPALISPPSSSPFHSQLTIPYSLLTIIRSLRQHVPPLIQRIDALLDLVEFGAMLAHPPVVRGQAHKLPGKVRRLALKTALSAKQAEGKLVVLDTAMLKEGKTAHLAKRLDKLGWTSALVIDGPEVDANFARAASDAQLASLGGDVAHPSIGLVVLLVIHVLNIYKPRGRTRRGQRTRTRSSDLERDEALSTH